MPTILITGCSTGFGLETARLFAERGWNVVATMRTVRDDVLPASERIRVIALDVTDAASIAAAIDAAGPIDALVNNAGLGLFNAVEATPMAEARAIFETNTLGTIAMTQAVVPQMRERGAGVIVNVSSAVTLRSLPLLAIYSASKAAVNAFTDSVALELAAFGIRTRVVLPGRAPDTRFGDNARARMAGGFPEPYAPLLEQIVAARAQDDGPLTTAPDVAEAVWQAVTDENAPRHIAAGADAVAWANEG